MYKPPCVQLINNPFSLSSSLCTVKLGQCDRLTNRHCTQKYVQSCGHSLPPIHRPLWQRFSPMLTIGELWEVDVLLTEVGRGEIPKVTRKWLEDGVTLESHFWDSVGQSHFWVMLGSLWFSVYFCEVRSRALCIWEVCSRWLHGFCLRERT